MIFYKVDVPGPLLGKDPCGSILVNDHLLSDHSVFAFWVVAYGRFDCAMKLVTIIWSLAWNPCRN